MQVYLVCVLVSWYPGFDYEIQMYPVNRFGLTGYQHDFYLFLYVLGAIAYVYANETMLLGSLCMAMHIGLYMVWIEMDVWLSVNVCMCMACVWVMIMYVIFVWLDQGITWNQGWQA